ncbi:DUF6185 family protein [Streptomyces sp. NPDC048179]|uniref:DUF6185 family protein n=1 Tax=Streptomyces sp. NPDC048179 TaxID=3365506 RepID=UPI00371F4095
MAKTRWWRLLSLLVLVSCMWTCGPASAQQWRAPGAGCQPERLKGSSVAATLRVRQHKQSHPWIVSDMTVRVPRLWPLAKQLTFSVQSPQYRKAMRCLLLGDETPESRNEWQPRAPVVTATDSSVEVHYVAYSWITTDTPFLVGPWEIVPTGRTWMVYLFPPTLQTVRWKRIEADLDGLGFSDLVERAASSTENKLVWKNTLPQEVQLKVDPPRHRQLTATLTQSFWATAGVASWWACASILIAVAALRARRTGTAAAHGTPPPPPVGDVVRQPAADVPDLDPDPDLVTGHVTSLTRTLLEWAVLSGAVALALLLLIPPQGVTPRSNAVICIPAGLALVLIARPWVLGAPPTARRAGPDEPTRSGGVRGIRRRQARAVTVATCAVAGIGLLVIVAHGVFGLPENLKSETTTVPGRIGLVLLSLATVWLWLAAMLAWAWRFAQEGGLLREHWTRQWNTVPEQCVAVVGGLLAAVAGILLAIAWRANAKQWGRVNWLAEQHDPAAYNAYQSKLLENFFFSDLKWIFAYSWVLTGIALLALLRYRDSSARTQGHPRFERFSAGPAKLDLLLTVSLFAFFVGVRAAKLVGASALYCVWLVLNIAAVYAVLGVGRRWSVVNRMGESFYAKRLGTEPHRDDLRKKASHYLEVNQQMRLLDRGHAGGATHEGLEKELEDLRGWLVAACGGADPPEQISVLDIALAWGPDGRWWSNAVRAARLAFWFGLPATGLLLYYQAQEPFKQAQLRFTPIGIPELVADSILYQMAWAAAGFTLGALWRLLPGRRSQARAWLLTAAYGVPVVLAAAFIHFIDTDPVRLLLYTALLLCVLTLTSIWMDLATFRKNREHLPSRFALLMFVFQLRGLSVQIAWVLVQTGAIVGIWLNLKR